ncbi:MAG: polysaccharide pyruvyl transferase CsaB [Defluviitaleaceae bacterium]|nr:polysaccharide pyruvyl transferase CsaB [Defluviitaleaceae bacterium]
MNSFEGTKVLHALNGMDFGGAETHVLELCKELARRGLEVFVVSNGGAYEGELVRAGIKHFRVPLHSKRPTALITSYFAIKRIIREHDIGLVHAHARIPAFLCGLLAKKMQFRFVTTAHALFNPAAAYKLLTTWGEATLAVAEDIREDLIKKFKLPPEQIRLTRNGIDTDKFNRNIDFADIYDELGLAADAKCIVTVGRLDKDMSITAHRLLDIAPEIYFRDVRTRLIIVGSGSDFDNVLARALEINERLRVPFVILTGGRTDVNKFFSCAQIYVGASRSALEAMLCETPVIIAGGQGAGGYIGIFGENTLDAAIATNFTTRGHEEITADKLRRDIFELMNISPDKHRQMGEYGRDTAIAHYSVSGMADDALGMYTAVRKSPRAVDALISGYYGSNNHGDDTVLQAIIEHLRIHNADIKIQVISKRPRETREKYGIDAIYRFNFAKIFSVLKRTNVLIMGGGTLLQDFTSTRSLLYYTFVMHSAARARAKIMLYANGIGPLRLEKNRRRAAMAMERAHLISLRDGKSLEELRDLGLQNSNLFVTADPAFAYTNDDPECAKARLEELGLAGKKYFCVAIRSWKTLKDDFCAEMAVFCDYMNEKHCLSPLFVPMQPALDAEISAEVLKLTKTRGYYLEGAFTMPEILAIIGAGEFLVGMRLHAIIYGISCHVPCIGLVYDPKVAALFEGLGLAHFMDVEDVVGSRLIAMGEEVLDGQEEISAKMENASRLLCAAALENAQLAYDVINRDLF